GVIRRLSSVIRRKSMVVSLSGTWLHIGNIQRSCRKGGLWWLVRLLIENQQEGLWGSLAVATCLLQSAA
ncbi:hypothetical protein AMTR_s04861p00006030, partial [Amborella trichopoda]